MSEIGLSDVAPEAPPAEPARGRAPKRDRSLSRRMGLAGGVLLGVMVGLAVLASVLARHDPLLPSGRPFEGPSVSHPLGTNDVGQDLFAQLLHGSRISLTIGVVSALVAVVIGLGIALLAGYHRGPIDAVLMRVVDLTLAFPFLVLVIVLAAFFGRSLLTTVVVIAAVIWARPARVLRSQVIKVREFHHVVAARAMGASPWRIIGRHILPRVAPLAAAQFVRAANISVLIEASLAFLGLGDATRVSWGTMLYFANSRNAILTDAWVWWIVPPGLALTTAVLGFAFLGYAIEEWADPRLSRSTVRRATRRRRRPLAVATANEEVPPGRVLQVRDLGVHYKTPAGPVRAVDGVSVDVGQGEIVGLVGESGSGKSTIAMALMGLARRPARVVGGSMVLNGRELVGLRQPQLARIRGRQVALVPQSSLNALNPAYTVHRQVAEAAALTRPEPQEASARAHELLDLVGIPRQRHGAFPHELSGGMRQRVVIA
ncbi:MAG TPA: ABC transporter permease subunit, partial [Acidimicrobiales bacterium]|nr:ABC transporter permease subunit [Acidimicrobiales bacterium]